MELLLALLLSIPVDTIMVRGTVRSGETGAPIEAATVRIVQLGLSVVTDSTGRYGFEGLPRARLVIRASALGYGAVERLIEPTETPRVDLDFELPTRPIHLSPLSARARAGQSGGVAERELFEREVAPALVGISGREIQAVPALGEADVLRALQAIPDVTPLNDLTAELHVQGGAADQNVYFWDGARIFAPYHVFGMFGAISADATGRVNFFRGHIPARYGGALSSVVDIAAPASIAEPLLVKAGLSILGFRAMARGQSNSGQTDWLVAGRTTHADKILGVLFDRTFPYSFSDAQARASYRVSDRVEVQGSALLSADRFEMFLDGFDGSMRSRWSNAALAGRWSYRLGEAVSAPSLSGKVWGSGYTVSLRNGTASVSPLSRGNVLAGGGSAELMLPGAAVGYRMGVDAEVLDSGLQGASSTGSYFVGSRQGRYLLVSAYAEAESWLGPLRASPGVRFSYDFVGGRGFVEPRIGARLYLNSDVALTAGISRTHQIHSTLRDDRYVLPGSPFWFVRNATEPVSRSDALVFGLEAWRGHDWSAHVTGYARHFENIPRWNPVGTRSLDQIGFDDGEAVGASVFLRRHQGKLTGWAGFSVSDVQFVDPVTGQSYQAVWEREHAIDAAVFFKPGDRVTISWRAVYGSGTHFWPQAGSIDSHRLSPVEGRIGPGEDYPVWGTQQLRGADYFRMDGSIAIHFSFAGYDMEAFLSMLNLGLRPNVLYYRLTPRTRYVEGNRVVDTVLEPTHVLPAFPSVGLNLWF